MAIYTVLHQVGPHMADEVIEITAEEEEVGVDVQRLLDLDAIREATKDEAKNAVRMTLGSVIRPIPQVTPKPEAVKKPAGTPKPEAVKKPAGTPTK